jgi:hypothetical protein
MTLEDLGLRAVACKHWRWMPGMITHSGERVFAVDNKENVKHIFVLTPGQFVRSLRADERVPRIDDPATLGCLLALVREAWTRDADFNEWVAYAVPIFDGLETWRVGCFTGEQKMIAICNMSTMKPVDASTEAEALVAALEAAP